MVEHHTYTAILIILAFINSILAGLFFTFSQSEITKSIEHDTNEKLRSASGNLLIAYILAYIAGGICLLLGILYFFQGILGWKEIVHAIVFLLIFVLLIVSMIFGFLALSDIDESNTGHIGRGWLIGAEIALVIALLLIIVSGAWRAQHVSSTAKRNQARTIEVAPGTRISVTNRSVPQEFITYQPAPTMLVSSP